jgi:hypothetical protein
VIAGASANALSTLTNNLGSLTLGRSLQPNAGLTNSGTIKVSLGTLSPTTFTQTEGLTTVSAAGKLAPRGTAAPVRIEGGTLAGLGTVIGNISGDGSVFPDGVALKSTSYTQNPDSFLLATVGPTGASQLSTSGAMTLGGKLRIQTAAGFVPALGTTYTIAKAANLSGNFSFVTGKPVGDRQYVVGVDPVTDTVTLTVKQQPAITSANAATFSTGQAGTFTVTTTGYEKPAVTVIGTLPSGVAFVDNGDGTGKLSGMPAAGTAGTYPLTVKATNGLGTATQPFTLTVATQEFPS